MESRPGSSATVREAATVVVARPGMRLDAAPEFFMLRRSAKSSFMPDALVFPGGRVEAEDGPAGSDEAFLQAAQRECTEEAALRLAPETLRWFDTWMTPSGESPRRFIARFFWAALPPGAGSEARADEVETTQGRWASARATLDLWRVGEVDLPPPTLSIMLALAELKNLDQGPFPERQPEELRAPILPKVAPIGSELAVVMPHDETYPELPGEALPAPSRSANYPRRFLRRGKSWTPITSLVPLVLSGLGLSGLLMGATACEQRPEGPSIATTSGSPAPEAEPKAAENSAAGSGAVQTAGDAKTQGEDSAGAIASLFAWLDPNAGAALYLHHARNFDPHALEAVFGIPPRALKLYKDALFSERAMETALGEKSKDLLGPEALAFTPGVSTGNYLLRPLRKSPEELQKALEAARFTAREVDGFTVLTPTSQAFGAQIVILNDQALAIVPQGEIGAGLAPLTAGRDLPPSQVEREMTQFIDEQSGVEMILHAGGPMLHLDLSSDVLASQFALRALPGAGGKSPGLDARVRLALSGPPEEAVSELMARELPGESEQVRAIAKRVAFGVDAGGVAGRLELRPEELIHLEAR